MAALVRLAAAICLCVSATAQAESVADSSRYIAEASSRTGVPAAWIARVMRIESGGKTTRNGRPIRSRAGAMGLMQLMPATWADMRNRAGLGDNPDDPHDNIVAGALYLRLMYEQFGYPGLFAAYNAGPARYGAYLAGKQRLPLETVEYLAAASTVPARAPIAVASQTLFAVRNALWDETAPNAARPPGESLFAVRKTAE
jgi:soluble lytic murein transglycosylase-like protein